MSVILFSIVLLKSDSTCSYFLAMSAPSGPPLCYSQNGSCASFRMIWLSVTRNGAICVTVLGAGGRVRHTVDG